MSAVIYPTTNFKAIEQLVIDRGEGIYVYDKDGKQYLEGMAGLWCTSLGYGNQEIIAASNEQMKKMSFTHMFGGKTHQAGIDLANRLAEMVPVENAKVFFGNSGSDANDTHIKLLRYYFNALGKPEKRKIITRERAYHGVTVAAGSLTSLPANLTHFDSPIDALGILRTDHPHYYRGANNGESEAEFVNRITNNLEQLIVREGPETIAAFIAEPITGASGVIVPPAGYYEKVQTILQRYNILFWADEVITGFGRTGNDFGCTTMNIKQPDMMTLAKQMSSAYYPISASIIRSELYEAMVELSSKVGVFGHGYTYSGHPVGCAIALKVLEIYQRDNIFKTAASTGDYLQRRLKAFSDHPLVGEVRGKGMIAALELVANKTTKAAFTDGSVGAKAVLACQHNGLIVRAVAGNSLALCPPLITTEAQVDEIMEKLGKALDSTLEHTTLSDR
ncbi:aminotransferase, class III [marine gamma proteobacterium HTCC2143]|uniref:Aminotransferase, class III n=1 Tax=marine gamma proteobacterium HTCC2143 TaxID=247633 RepID=A0YBA5_9GAMM|nr:aminotransferase, class III [marine gamma proteobacterium HTCC2143]